MPKHNNVIPNSHFHKEWQLRVRTWFNQPAQKKKRAGRRAAKAARIFPRPAGGPLRPVVHCATVKYNSKKRLGRGFNLAELKAAGIPRQQALSIGIAVDHRRRNKSEESFQENVQLLKKYRANLILFPRQAKHPRKGDSAAEDLQKVEQQPAQTVSAVKFTAPKARKPEQPKTTSFTILRRARADARLIGKRKKRAEAAAEAEKLKAKSGGD